MIDRCPRCHQPLDRSTSLIPGRVVIGCRRTCRVFAVEVEGVETEWVEGGPGLVERLGRSVASGEAVRAIVESDGDDPRWTEMVL
jgi:hypothetical protein